MKISCSCGYDIADTSDELSHKAELIADQDWGDLREELARHVDPYAALRRHTAAAVYQCPDCGRLVIQRGRELYWFTPEGPVVPLLYSARGAEWPRSLSGLWFSGRGELVWGSSSAPDDQDSDDLRNFSSWEELKELYDHTFERLLAAGRLRSALITRDGEVVHSWPPEDAGAGG